MKKYELVNETEFVDEAGVVFLLKFFITDNSDCREEGLYGIVVEKHLKSLDNELLESEDSGNLPFNKKQVKSIANLLARNKITPISFLYVIDDYIGYME